MSSQTIVTFVDDDGDEFPVSLPGVYESNRGAGIEAGLQVAQESIAQGGFAPNGALRFERVEYLR